MFNLHNFLKFFEISRIYYLKNLHNCEHLILYLVNKLMSLTCLQKVIEVSLIVWK